MKVSKQKLTRKFITPVSGKLFWVELQVMNHITWVRRPIDSPERQYRHRRFLCVFGGFVCCLFCSSISIICTIYSSMSALEMITLWRFAKIIKFTYFTFSNAKRLESIVRYKYARYLAYILLRSTSYSF